MCHPAAHRSAVLLALALAVAGGALACGSALDPEHPVAGGSWPPTTGDVWPARSQAVELSGCRAYGGLRVQTRVMRPEIANAGGQATITPEGIPTIVINPETIVSQQPLFLSWLYYHECAHHMLQHPAFLIAGATLDPVQMEFDANCEAALHVRSTGKFSVEEMTRILGGLSVENRLPGEVDALTACLRSRGLL